MDVTRSASVITRIDLAEYALCARMNRASRHNGLRRFLSFVSRIGNGPVWYALLVLQPLLYGEAGLRASGVMAGSGLVALGLYKAMKRTFARERPFVRHAGISLVDQPLDRYSFPSGHTLHAVMFTWQAVAFFPELAFVLVPLTTLIALSRTILGLHYPTDVLAGACLGAAVAVGGLLLTR